MVITCTGRGDKDGDHCCWVHGKVCEFLVDNTTPGDGRFRCGLMAELGDWEKVHKDPRYSELAVHFAESGLCGDWQPAKGQCCNEAR